MNRGIAWTRQGFRADANIMQSADEMNENMPVGGRYPEHDICENFSAIDVRELQRKGQWRPGQCFGKEWFLDGAPAKVFIFTHPDAVTLIHRARAPGAAESRIIELRVPIIWTKCHFGGRRPWFECLTLLDNGEACGLRVAKLYGPCFECRRCMGLRYASQRETPQTRAWRRAQMIKIRLGGSNDPLDPFPQKPRGMHWRTYLRLRDQADAAEAEAEYLWAKSIPGPFLEPVPPRRKRRRGHRDAMPQSE
jgi:hypothetical protein